MPDRDDTTRAYVRGLREQRDAYLDVARGEVAQEFLRRDRRPPESFEPSSFLYLRSFDGDTGARPFSGHVFWRSPDIAITPLTGVGVATTQLDAGATYRVRCTLRNRGDLGVPSAKVELFLTDPTLGFDTRYATNLTLGRVPSTWVGSGGTGSTEFAYTVPPNESGHKCLFARAFSFSPLELPVDDHQLDPRLDRRVAQLNLNIVGASQPFPFHVVHPANARLRIELTPMTPEVLLRMRHPALADLTPSQEFPRRGWGRLAQLDVLDTEGEVDVAADAEGLRLTANDGDAIDLESLHEVDRMVAEALRSVGAGRSRMVDHRDLFATFREVRAQTRRTSLTMTTPDIGLQRGQAIGLDVRAIDEHGRRPEVVGGLTVVIVGG